MLDFYKKIEELICDDVCIENVLVAIKENYINWVKEHKLEGFPENVKINEEMIKKLDSCIEQNREIQEHFAGC